ncbi:MAG: DUF4209 domain-containing protein [Geodermatophilaceae bacterium]|nr:DUF4209 domain-containing protein [Geodermatophilaceae bacterium]
MEYERAIAEDSLIGLWGFSFDRLVINHGTSDPGLMASLVADLEERLARLTGPGVTAVDARAIEAAALRLATHYRARNESDDVSRVLRLFRGAYEKAAAEENPLVAYAWLERVHGVLVSYNLRVDAEQLAIVLRGYAKKGLGSMSEISVDVPVPSDKLEEFLKAIFEGSVDEALTRIALRYVPRRTDLEESLKEQADSFPFQYIFQRSIKDSEGRTAAQVGPLHADMEGHVVHLMSQQLTYVAYFLRNVIERMPAIAIEPDVFATFVFRSWLCEEERRELIRRGIADVFAGDYPVAIHILVPQIEHLVRRAAEAAGVSLYRPAAHGGGVTLKLLDTILREDALEQAFGADLLLYLRVLLTDQRGWNVRNTVCHGMMTPSSMGPMVADRLLHLLLILALLTGATSGQDTGGSESSSGESSNESPQE